MEGATPISSPSAGTVSALAANRRRKWCARGARAVWHLRDDLAEAIDVTIRQFETFQRAVFPVPRKTGFAWCTSMPRALAMTWIVDRDVDRRAERQR